nr:hypothetical protein [Tanacetum cinerariifolium]
MIKDSLMAKPQRATSETFKEKDIVKEVEDYLKTYSPTEMDIRWPLSPLCTPTNPLPKPQNQWSHANRRLANQDKRLKRPSETKDTKIAALRLKFNAFKVLEGEKVNGTFTRLRSQLNDLENNGVSISQAEVNATLYNYKEGLIDQIYESKSSRFTLQGSKALISNPTMQESDSYIEEDQRSSSELLADLNTEFHKRALIANQRRFYKRSGRIDAINKGKNEKGLVAESFNKDEELVSFDDDGVTTFKALMAVADELSVGKMSTEGDAINFNENRSFLNDEFQEPKRKIPQGSYNNKHLSYVLTYDPLSSNNINISKNHTLTDCAQNSVSPEEQLEPLNADDSLVLNEPIESANNIAHVEVQLSFINEPISEAIPSTSIPSEPLAFGIQKDQDLISKLIQTSRFDYKLIREKPPRVVPPIEAALSAKKQSYVAVSSAEAKYVTATRSKVENNIITFSLSHVEKHLSFNHDLFSSIIGLDYAKKFESLPSHEDVKEGLPTLGLTDENSPNLSSVALSQSFLIIITYFSPTWKILMTYIVKCLGGNQGSHDQLDVNQQMIAYALCRDLKIDITGILFNGLVTKLSAGGKKEREKNICYVRHMSIIMEHLLRKYYLNDDLKPMKSYQMTDATFKNSKIHEVPLTSHMQRIAQLPEKPLNPFSKEVNIKATISESETFKSKEDYTHSQHIELSKSEERYADKLIEELADMNASAKKPSLSDPLSYLCNEVSNLTTKDMVAILESTLVFAKANAEGEKWEKNNLESPKSAADVDNAQDEQKSDDIAKVQKEQHSDNKSEDANENQKSAAEKVNTDSALIIHPLEDEPPSKKPSSDGGQMKITKAKAQIEELRKIKLLKAEKEKSDKELLKKLNHVKDQTLKLVEYEAKRPVKYLSAQESKSKDSVGIDSSWKEDIKVDGMHRNLIPPRGVIGSPGLVITETEAGIFYYNGNYTPEAQQMVKKLQFAIEARDDVDEARKIVRDNLDDGLM